MAFARWCDGVVWEGNSLVNWNGRRITGEILIIGGKRSERRHQEQIDDYLLPVLGWKM